MLGKPSQRYSRVATGSVWSRGAQPSSPCLHSLQSYVRIRPMRGSVSPIRLFGNT